MFQIKVCYIFCLENGRKFSNFENKVIWYLASDLSFQMAPNILRRIIVFPPFFHADLDDFLQQNSGDEVCTFSSAASCEFSLDCCGFCAWGFLWRTMGCWKFSSLQPIRTICRPQNQGGEKRVLQIQIRFFFFFKG